MPRKAEVAESNVVLRIVRTFRPTLSTPARASQSKLQIATYLTPLSPVLGAGQTIFLESEYSSERHA